MIRSLPTARILPVMLTVVAFLAGAKSTSGVQPDSSFRDKIAPIFERACLSCHNENDRKGGLSLESADGLRKGGESGVVVEPGNPRGSLLLDYISGPKPQMPKEGKPLAKDEVEAIRAWVAAGAAWPASVSLKDHRLADANWWSLKPLIAPDLPKLSAADERWCRTPIDRFILAKLREKGLSPSPEADRRTQIRRLSFDLLGLPPSPDEIETFVADPDAKAYDNLVDRLLASPQYGERWARHWLDVVHYGDTHGFDKDKIRPNAWPYRDYVIRALNDDKPYHRFVEEQLAGDVLYPATRDGIVALGFIAAGPFDYVGHIEVPESKAEGRNCRSLDRDDMVRTTMETFTSMTVGCARCHNHKFDPITQEDYYSLQAVFAAVDRAERPYDIDPKETESKQLEAKLLALPPRGMVYAGATEFAPEGSHVPTHGKPREISTLRRGDVQSPIKPVGPGSVACIAALPARFTAAAQASEGDRRVALARWINDSKNPLTWRSIVNRTWHYHMGRGLVETLNDFGRMGGRPTHPELLDWLALWFRDEGGQSFKRLHKLIVMSAVYRQSSGPPSNPPSDSSAPQSVSRAQSLDAGNQFLWRMNRRKLEAEAIRDAVLAVSGQLDRTMGGPGFQAFVLKDDHSPHYLYDQFDPDEPKSHRRSIYRLIVRSVPDPFLETLDCADPSLIVERRNETITPLQALSLLNNKFMVRMAEHFADRVTASLPANADWPTKVDAAFRLALGRLPTAEERGALVNLGEKHGLANVCRVIFNTSEFVFVD